MEPNYEQPPQVQLRPQMPKHIKTIWLIGGIIFLVAGLLFLFWAANAAVAARANAIEPARIIFFILIPPLVVWIR